MTFDPTVFTVVLLFAAATALALAVVAERRDTVGGRAFSVMLVAIALWCLGDAGQYGVTSLSAYRLWTFVGMVGSATAPTAALVFALQYAGFDEWVTRRSVALLAVEPAVTIALLATNGVHGLLWRYTGELTLQPVTHAPTVAGPWFTFHLAYTYGVMAAAMGTLVLLVLRGQGVYRRQATLMLTGGAVPLAVNLLWLVGASPVAGVDLSSVTFAFTGVVFAVALYRYDLLDVTPVASHTLVAGLRDAVVAVDREGRVTAANPVARRLFDDGGRVVGEPASTVLPEYETIVEATTSREADGLGDTSWSGPVGPEVTLTADGEERTFAISRSPLSDAGGDAGDVLLFRDVTERRRVERRYQALIENASDLIHVLEPDGTIDYVSPSVERVLGYDPAEVEGTNAVEYVHPDDRDMVTDRLQAIAADRNPELQAEFRVRTADGDYRVVEARGRNLVDDPVVGGIVVNSRDVTRRDRRERALRSQNEQLEAFASVISHDLRNPLAVARGYAGVLEREYDDDRIDEVVAAHRRMDELLDDLLTLAREGRTVDEMEPVELSETARMAWATVETGDATLSVPAEGTVLADQSRLRQLFENLFRNAVEHGGAGVTVTVGDLREPCDPAGAGETAPDADSVAGRSDGGTGFDGFYVADDGPGIPPEKRDEVFDVGVTTQDEGTGFGLTIVRRVAEAHGWRVECTEGEAGGARFEFSEVDLPE